MIYSFRRSEYNATRLPQVSVSWPRSFYRYMNNLCDMWNHTTRSLQVNKNIPSWQLLLIMSYVSTYSSNVGNNFPPINPYPFLSCFSSSLKSGWCAFPSHTLRSPSTLPTTIIYYSLILYYGGVHLAVSHEYFKSRYERWKLLFHSILFTLTTSISIPHKVAKVPVIAKCLELFPIFTYKQRIQHSTHPWRIESQKGQLSAIILSHSHAALSSSFCTLFHVSPVKSTWAKVPLVVHFSSFLYSIHEHNYFPHLIPVQRFAHATE